MGSVLNRGTRDRPRWVAQYRDSDGRWRQHTLRGVATKAEARGLLAGIEKRVAEGQVGLVRVDPSPLCGPLMEEWLAGLKNRAAYEYRVTARKHLLATFGPRRMADVQDVRAVLRWLTALDGAGLSAWRRRALMNLLGGFFSWAVLRGHARHNPVRDLPRGVRPMPQVRRDAPWVEDDAVVRRVFHALPEPVNLIFYLGNRCGVRPGEACGLRLSDLEWLHEGVLRVRFSRLGPLKEDHRGEGKVKWAPAPDEAHKLLAPWVARRRAAGAGPEDLVFADPGGGPVSKMQLSRAWKEVRAAVPEVAGMSLYEATRHSFTTRALRRGGTLDETSAALGHSTPAVTRTHYDHLVRKTFSPALREGLGLSLDGAGDVVELPRQGRAGVAK